MIQSNHTRAKIKQVEGLENQELKSLLFSEQSKWLEWGLVVNLCKIQSLCIITPSLHFVYIEKCSVLSPSSNLAKTWKPQIYSTNKKLRFGIAENSVFSFLCFRRGLLWSSCLSSCFGLFDGRLLLRCRGLLWSRAFLDLRFPFLDRGFGPGGCLLNGLLSGGLLNGLGLLSRGGLLRSFL